METSTLDIDASGFKKIMEEAPSKDNGWQMEYEGVARKDYPDSKLYIHKKKIENGTLIVVRVETTLKGFDAGNIYKMMQDLNIRSKWDPIAKQIKLIEQLDKNSDIIYQEVGLPFPLTNRDYVQKRVYLCNQEDKELVKSLGLYELDHKYYVIMAKSTERTDYPAKDSPVRGETKMNYWFMEEDSANPGFIKIKVIMCQDLKGSVPFTVIDKASSKMPHKLIGGILDNYSKYFAKP